ncbi:Uncharacterised protein [Mycobacterium tuberculosis]|uniref:Uncharacterized protein n=1 Tax=Mycobacterium tuberculosis TaxID=1773 RepID=A0A916LFU9_MYCTX|nr:Uncharacterised protein [Mycobacterium tuberculosis]CPA97182.1 Uncharacterised protein [Mycobacterium tuberculosis]SGO17768.1 Uncharacterised protein [Mycobacterium tuberculosis]
MRGPLAQSSAIASPAPTPASAAGMRKRLLSRPATPAATPITDSLRCSLG